MDLRDSITSRLVEYLIKHNHKIHGDVYILIFEGVNFRGGKFLSGLIFVNFVDWIKLIYKIY